MLKYCQILIISLFIFKCKPAKTVENNQNYKSETLIIQKISNQVYQHTSFLVTESFGKVTCNGMIVLTKNEAIIYDTPADTTTSLELIKWVENKLHGKIKAIIPTHFHADCLGGLEAFHQRGIPSYANYATIKSAQLNNSAIPQNGFNNLLELK